MRVSVVVLCLLIFRDASADTIVTCKNNKTHFEKRTRKPRPYELFVVKGKVST